MKLKLLSAGICMAVDWYSGKTVYRFSARK